MAKYKVLAEFIDLDKNVRVHPGSTIDVKGKKADRLLKAGVLEEVKKDGTKQSKRVSKS